MKFSKTKVPLELIERQLLAKNKNDRPRVGEAVRKFGHEEHRVLRSPVRDKNQSQNRALSNFWGIFERCSHGYLLAPCSPVGSLTNSSPGGLLDQ